MEEENFLVKAYLDEDTKQLPGYVTGDRFVERINSVLQTYFDPKLHLVSATGFGAFENFDLPLDENTGEIDKKANHAFVGRIFNSPGVEFSFNYLPKRPPECKACKNDEHERVKDLNLTLEEKKKRGLAKSKLSYLRLKECIYKDLGDEHERPDSNLSPVLICTSDEDFVDIIEMVKSLGHKVLLFANRNAETKLLESAHLCSTRWF